MDAANPPLAGRQPAIPDGLRVYAVGDVHGRLDLLREIEAQIEADARSASGKRVIQVMLGDYIDRGPDSSGVIAHLIERRRQRELVTLRGNHEDYTLGIRHAPDLVLRWCRFGGVETLAVVLVGHERTVAAAPVIGPARHGALTRRRAEHTRPPRQQPRHIGGDQMFGVVRVVEQIGRAHV